MTESGGKQGSTKRSRAVGTIARTSNISRRRRAALSDGSAEYTAKREEIVRVAAELFRSQGYHATRLADVGARAGIDRASIYYYFGSKEDLFRESVEGILDANLARTEEVVARDGLSTVDRIRLIVEQLMLSYEQNYPHMYVYIQEQMHQVAREESAWAQEIARKTRAFDAKIVALLRLGVDTGELRGDIPLRVASSALFGMFNWTHRWFTPGGGLSAREIADAFCNIFFEGMTALPRRSRAKN